MKVIVRSQPETTASTLAPDERVIRAYMRDVVSWHGYVRFLGLPSLQQNPDVPIEELYVPHFLSSVRVDPESPPDEWRAMDPLDELERSRCITVLGDPGSGKSTLINWIAWRLAIGASRALPDAFRGAIPIVLVLREMELTDVRTMHSLVNAFLARPVGEALRQRSDLLWSAAKQRRLVVLLDGLDEVSTEARRGVIEAIRDGLRTFDLRVLCTSRLVGYEELPMRLPDRNSSTIRVGPDAGRDGKSTSDDSAHFPVHYILPFRDAEIARFALNWYRDQESSDRKAKLYRDDFVEAVFSSDSTRRLARTPNLLTMMAQVFRVRARLPNGRALLYSDIAQAYLESIDTARNIKDPFPWSRKLQWMAKIGFELQILRASGSDEGLHVGEREVLVRRERVLGWLEAAVSESGEPFSPEYARRYLDWIAKRSGLLLPRGEELFAFLHLSFQEYFAAVYVVDQMRSSGWGTRKRGNEPSWDSRVSPRALQEWSAQTAWHQTCVFVFELLAGSRGWVDTAAHICFVERSKRSVVSQKPSSRARPLRVNARARLMLAVELLNNSHISFQSGTQAMLLERIWSGIVEDRKAQQHVPLERLGPLEMLLSAVLNSAVVRSSVTDQPLRQIAGWCSAGGGNSEEA